MQIQIQTDTKTFTLTVNSSDKIKSVKDMIQEKEGIPANQQILYYEGDELYDAYTLSDYDIKDGSTVTLEREE